MILWLAVDAILEPRRILGLLATIGVAVLVIGAPILGFSTQPWWPWWIGERSTVAAIPVDVGAIQLGPPPAIDSGRRVSDAERYQLALAAGWSASDAITAVAISIAENGSGDPAALSGLNFDNSRDLGLWQLNSQHWSRYGGQAALTDPLTNARAAHDIYLRSGWCAWSTFDTSCGRGHTGSYRSFLNRAMEASR